MKKILYGTGRRIFNFLLVPPIKLIANGILLETPVTEKSLEISLKPLTTFDLKMEKVFLNTNLISKYTGNIKFEMIYISSLNANYSLRISSFNFKCHRIVVELKVLEAQKNQIKTKSSNKYTENKKTKDVEINGNNAVDIYSKIPEIDAELQNFMIIINLYNSDDSLKTCLKGLTLKYTKKEDVLRLFNLETLSLFISRKRYKESIAKISNVSANLTKSLISINLDLIEIALSENSIKFIFALINSFIPEQTSENQEVNTNGNATPVEIPNIKLFINSIILYVEGISLSINGVTISVENNHIKAEITDISAKTSNEEFLNISNTEAEYIMKDITKAINTFALAPGDWQSLLSYEPPSGTDSDKINFIIQSISFSLTRSLAASIPRIVALVGSVLQNIKPRPVQQADKAPNASSADINGKIGEVKASVSEIGVSLEEISMRALIGPKLSHFYGRVPSLAVSCSDKFDLLRSTEGDFLRAAVNIEGDTISTSIDVGNILVRMLGYMPQINSTIDFVKSIEIPSISEKTTETEKSPENENKPISINGYVSIREVFFDYMAIEMPARIMFELTFLTVSAIIETSPFTASANVSTLCHGFITNQRRDLYESQFINSFHYSEAGFAKIGDIAIKTIKVKMGDRIEIEIPEGDIEGGLCFDSLQLLMTLLSHIQYGLDFPAEKRPPLRSFEPPEQLLSMQSTLAETLASSLRIDPVEPKLGKLISRKLNDSIESLAQNAVIEESVNYDADEDECELFGARSPTTIPFIIIECKKPRVSFKLYSGKDLDSMFVLTPLTEVPAVHKGKTPEHTFEFVGMRNETQNMELVVEGRVGVSVFSGDPIYSLTIKMALSELEFVDHLNESPARAMLGIDREVCKEEEEFHLQLVEMELDLFSTTSQRTELSLKLGLPELFVFATQEQVDFLVDYTSAPLPAFPASTIEDELIAFQTFKLQPRQIRIFAHFRLWLDVKIDDVVVYPPACSLLATCGFDGLAGSLAEFYIGEMARPGVLAVAGGISVVRNLRRITGAVRDLFAFDARRYGLGFGLTHSLGALMRIVAAETLNAGVNATTLAERFLGAAVEALNGSEEKEEARAGHATLALRRQGARGVPTLVLAPGVSTMQHASSLLKAARNWIDPERNSAIRPYLKDAHEIS